MTTNLKSLSLTQLFGDGAYQNASFLVIQKASLLRLTPLPINTAESLLVGIILTALTNFAKGVITDENNQCITDGSKTITDENNNCISDENNQCIVFEIPQCFYFDNSESFELIQMIEWKPFSFTRNNQKYINNQIIVDSFTPYADSN